MSTIIIKNSSTPGNQPSTLAQGELAINTADGKMFYGNGAGVSQFPAIDTSSFSTTGSNTFKGNQTITGSEFVSGDIIVAQSITASSATFTSASIDYLYVNLFESASTIYSSGSNQFGDAPNDTQILYGSVRIPTGSLTVTGSLIATSFTGSLQGTASWATNFVSASNYVLNSATSSYATTGSNTFTGTQTITGSGNSLTIRTGVLTGITQQTTDFAAGVAGSNIGFGLAAATGNTYGTFTVRNTGGSTAGNLAILSSGGNLAIGKTIFNAVLDVNGNTIITGSLNVTAGITGSLLGTASFATTSSYVNTLNQNVIVTGSIAIGTGSVGNGENNLLIGPAPAGGAGEGGQIALLAAGGGYTSSSFIDNWQNQFRILRGPGATSNAGLMYMDLQTGNTQFVGAVTASAYSGLPNSWLHALRSGDQTIGSGTWASRDIVFNSYSSNNFTYNSSTGIATLKAGKTYRITARLAWAAAGLYTLKFGVYNQTTSGFTGPTVEMIQSPNGTYNVSDSTLEHIFNVGASDVDISIKTTSDTNALTGEYIRGDLNTQLIIQQIA